MAVSRGSSARAAEDSVSEISDSSIWEDFREVVSLDSEGMTTLLEVARLGAASGTSAGKTFSTPLAEAVSFMARQRKLLRYPGFLLYLRETKY